MSKNEVSENLFSHYLTPHEEKRTLLKSLQISKRKGSTLNEFYTEVQSQKNSHGIENIYYGKNAGEIETIMIQNRKRIEANYTKR